MSTAIDWNALLNNVESQVLTLAERILQDYIKQARSDAKDFLNGSKDFIVTAGEQLATGEIDQELFESELRGRLDDAEFLALEEAGLAQVRLDEFTEGVIKIITGAVLTVAKSMLP